MANSWVVEFQQSIKSPDTEEKLDLIFYRPLGFMLAKVADGLRMTPTQLSVLGLLIGLVGGRLYYYGNSFLYLFLGSVLFVLSGIFDSADGQLARLSGKGTPLGLVIDGTCDGFVFFSVYIHASLAIPGTYAWYVIVPIAILAGLSHFYQSATLDFYNKEYLSFGYGKRTPHTWNISLEDTWKTLRNSSSFGAKFVNMFGHFWVWLQYLSVSRTTEQRMRLKALTEGPNAALFQTAYKEQNLTLLRFWRLMGANFHTIMIIVFVFIGRFDLYLILVDLLFLNLAIVVLRYFQRAQDKKLFAYIEEIASSEKP